MIWRTVKLGDVCKTTSGGTPKRDVADFYNGEIHWVKSGELKDCLIKTTSERISQLGLDNSSAKLIPKGTLLIALYGATVGKLGILDIEAASNQAVCAISPSEIVHQKYLFHYLFKIRSKLIERSTGGAQPNISQDIIRNLEIPLPPLPEQKRIAEVLDKADALREKRRLALQKLDTLLQSVFLEMFGDPVKNPKGFERGTIRDLVSSVNYGTSEKAGQDGEFPILRMNNITFQGGWNFADLKYIDFSEKDRKKYFVKKGEILFNRTNSKELVGKTAVYREDYEMAFAGYLIQKLKR